jgi:predicted nucleic acid-binding protein
MILIDTNIILRSKHKVSHHHHEVTDKLIDLITNGEELVICPQVVYEFYVVATRRIDQNGLGLSMDTALSEIENILVTYSMPVENEMVFQNWRQLVSEYKVTGKKAHDTRIVAFMISNNINKLYTLNKADFVTFNKIIELV